MRSRGLLAGAGAADALGSQSGVPLAAVPQAGLSCDCLSVPAVQVRGCSAQQV